MILAVVGGADGVGTSTVAYNLGAALDAVVVDADLGLADLTAGRGPDLQDALAGRAAPVESVRDGGPVALLPCGRPLTGVRAADPERLVEVLGGVAARYGRVVLDCPAGSNGDAGLPLLAADACLLVTTPGRVALAAAARVGNLARERDAGIAGVVLARAGPAVPVVAERTLGGAVVTVPEPAAVARSMRHGLPVAAITPADPAVGAFDALAAAVQRSCRS